MEGRAPAAPAPLGGTKSARLLAVAGAEGSVAVPPAAAVNACVDATGCGGWATGRAFKLRSMDAMRLLRAFKARVLFSNQAKEAHITNKQAAVGTLSTARHGTAQQQQQGQAVVFSSYLRRSATGSAIAGASTWASTPWKVSIECCKQAVTNNQNAARQNCCPPRTVCSSPTFAPGGGWNTLKRPNTADSSCAMASTGGLGQSAHTHTHTHTQARTRVELVAAAYEAAVLAVTPASHIHIHILIHTHTRTRTCTYTYTMPARRIELRFRD